MLSFITNQRLTETPAGEPDLFFLRDDGWLGDTAVIDRIEYRKGAWEISLTFTNYKNPLQLLVRKIITCYSEKKAEMAAFYVRRQAAKDKRGTLEVSIKDFNLCIN
ncbi:MAG: hypothetical protein ABIO46_15435 [Chitinophagales bacterium]